MAADGVDLVDEDDARRVRLPLLEQVAHAAGADADEHLDEVGARHREEGTPRLARDGLGQQRLAGSRRAHQQRALGQASAQPGELLRVLEELDDLLQLDLGLVRAGDVGERDLRRVAREQLRLGLAERERRLPPACSWRRRKNQSPRITIQGSAAMMIAVMPPLGSLAVIGTPASSRRLTNASLLATGSSTWKLLARPAVLGHRRAEVALEALAVEHLDARPRCPGRAGG